MNTHASWLVLSAALAAAFPFTVRGQLVAGENVNMVSGTEWPGGDPFLQRQNEPAIAVSSANPDHLMAGANDYRSVDIPYPAYGNKSNNGDAWLGVFKSLDGGQTWRSTLLAGYPQSCGAPPRDPLCEPAPSVCPAGTEQTCEIRAAADPVMRAGTDGMFYFSGINFSRDKARSRVFVARFLDANNKESGDPISHIDTRIVATAPPDTFVDKPWMVIDVPRTGALKCDIPADPAVGRPARSFPVGTIYVAWAQFAKPQTAGGWADRETRSDVLLSYSRDCGATWSAPVKLNGANSVLNQGVTLAIEPLSGRVYVAWRREASGTQGDAIMSTRSAGRSRTFAVARVAAPVTDPFEQGSTIGSFRTQAMPTLAISTDGKSSWAHIAWQQRRSPGGDSRIFMTSATVFPPPMGDQDPDDPEISDRETRLGWQPLQMVDDATLADDVRSIFARGHQVMPSLMFSQGKLVLVYYDTRLDHTRRYYRPNTDPATNAMVVDPITGRFYAEEIAPIGERVQPNGDTAPASVFNGYITDAGAAEPPIAPLTFTRHTIDVRVASAGPGLAPQFTPSTLVTRFPFGLRGDEYAGQTEPSFDPTTPLTVTDADGVVQRLQQLQMNPPNLPMFGAASKAFIGDYIDVRAPEFVPRKGGGGWDFNVAPTNAPVFHAVWTSNQDVKPPMRQGSDGQWVIDWTLPYTPVQGGGGTSLYDGTSTRPTCTVDETGRSNGAEGSRDQNIYTSRLTEGLLVTAPQNAKPLPLDGTPATFVILVQNSTSKAMPVSLRAATAEAGVDYRFAPFSASVAPVVLDATVPAFSSVSRTLFVRLAGSVNTAATLTVTAAETGCAACRSGTVTLNPPVAISSLLAADNSAVGAESYTVFGLAPNITNPNITNPNITNPNITNPNITKPNITNPNITNPNITNPNITNPNITNAGLANPNITNPNITNPNITNPNITNPNITNPNITNPNITNTSVADVSYTITNSGNTTTSYRIELVNTDPSWMPPSPIHLIVSKQYTTLAAADCALKEIAHDQLVVSIPDVSQLLVSRDALVVAPGQSSVTTNASVSLRPGESAKITERLFGTTAHATPVLEAAAQLASKVAPAVVPDRRQDGTTTYETAVTASAIGLVPTTMTVGVFPCVGDPSMDCVGVMVAPTSGTGAPTGSLTVIRNAVPWSGPSLIFGGAFSTAQFAVSPALAAGETLVILYPGDTTYGASTYSYTKPAQGWSPTGSLTTSREQHTATLLASGKVLVVGGMSFATRLVSAELYDPATGNWTPTGSLSRTRAAHTATLLSDGSVLVVGGEDTTLYPAGSAERYDPATGNWSPTGSLTVARWAGHTATLLPDGRVLVVGGEDAGGYRLASTELYDPVAGTWSATGSLGVARHLHVAVLLNTGHVLVVGGQDGVTTAELYDPAAGTWAPDEPLYNARSQFSATLLSSGQVLVAGGYGMGGMVADTELYDPPKHYWYPAGPLSNPRAHHTATLLSSGEVLVAGGVDSTSGLTSSTEMLDPASHPWTPGPSMGTPRWWHTATLLPSGKVLVVGGRDGSRTLASSELFDPGP